MKVRMGVSLLLMAATIGTAPLALTGCGPSEEPTSVDIPGVTSEVPTQTPAEQEPTLEGTDWTATGYSDGEGAVVPVLATTTVTLRFDGGAFAGDTGVNSYSGGYAVGEETLVIDPAMRVTERGGPTEAMDQESAYLAALGKTKAYRIEDRVLTLYDDAAARLATYRVTGD